MTKVEKGAVLNLLLNCEERPADDADHGGHWETEFRGRRLTHAVVAQGVRATLFSTTASKQQGMRARNVRDAPVQRDSRGGRGAGRGRRESVATDCEGQLASTRSSVNPRQRHTEAFIVLVNCQSRNMDRVEAR